MSLRVEAADLSAHDRVPARTRLVVAQRLHQVVRSAARRGAEIRALGLFPSGPWHAAQVWDFSFPESASPRRRLRAETFASASGLRKAGSPDCAALPRPDGNSPRARICRASPGRHYDYLVKALRDYKSGARRNRSWALRSAASTRRTWPISRRSMSRKEARCTFFAKLSRLQASFSSEIRHRSRMMHAGHSGFRAWHT